MKPRDLKNCCLSEEGVWEIHPKEMLSNKSTFILIDVRCEDEFVCECLENSKLLPLNTFSVEILNLDPLKSYVFVCATGRRSKKACVIAEINGFKNVYSLKGGIMEWKELGFEIIKNKKTA